MRIEDLEGRLSVNEWPDHRADTPTEIEEVRLDDSEVSSRSV